MCVALATLTPCARHGLVLLPRLASGLRVEQLKQELQQLLASDEH